MSIDRNERERYILDLLSRDGSLSVSRLARDLEVSEVTVRTYLANLEERGLLTRTRGGAEPTSFQSVLARSAQHAEEKERIAAAAAELITDNDRIMIEAGTTTALIGRHLFGKHGIQLVTNSTLAFTYARLNPGLHIILTGGNFHRISESMVGPVAERAINDFNVRLAFIGTDGFSLEKGLTTRFAEGSQVLNAMTQRAEQTWLLTDSSKFGQAGFVSVLPLSSLHGIITDEGIGDATHQLLQENVPVVHIV